MCNSSVNFSLYSASSSASYKQQASDIRMSVPEGAITASTVDNMASRAVNAKKQGNVGV